MGLLLITQTFMINPRQGSVIEDEAGKSLWGNATNAYWLSLEIGQFR